MTIHVTQVNGIAPDKTGTVTLLPGTTVIDVTGAGAKDVDLTCDLAGPSVFISRHPHGAGDGHWQTQFKLPGTKKCKVTYQLPCSNDSDASDQVTIGIVVPGVSAAQSASKGVNSKTPSIVLILAFNPPPNDPSFSQLIISASGTVLNGLDPVFCTLTPIDDAGQSRGPCQSSPASMNGNAWTVTFTPSPPAAVFLNPPPPNVYSGRYLLEATAANEGTISAPGSVQ
jgi:hypothetical protein